MTNDYKTTGAELRAAARRRPDAAWRRLTRFQKKIDLDMLVARVLKNSQLTCGERHAYFGDRTIAGLLIESAGNRAMLDGGKLVLMLKSLAFVLGAMVLGLQSYAAEDVTSLPRNQTLIVDDPEGTIRNPGWFNIWVRQTEADGPPGCSNWAWTRSGTSTRTMA